MQAYLDRVKAYNGICTALVTADGKPIKPAKGIVRAGKPVTFPTKTVAASTYLPDLDQYQGLPLEFGRMEPTLSDPSVQQQFGMRVGIPNAGQLNALETLNIRGERSVTCKGKFDTPPSAGPLPKVRRRPARNSGSSPTRSSGPPSSTSNTARIRISKPADVLRRLRVQELVRRERHARHRRQRRELRDGCPRTSIRPTSRDLRAKGAIIYAIANAAKAGRPGDPGAGESEDDTVPDGQSGVWRAGAASPAIRTTPTRVPRGSSNGSGVAVQREPRDLLDLRANRRLLQRPGIAQRHREPADDQGHH